MKRVSIIGVVMVGLSAALFGAASSPAPQPAGGPSMRELADQAAKAMAAGEFDKAIEFYEQLRPRLPQVAEVPYNSGVAAYRSGDMEAAAAFFREALAQGQSASLQSQAAESLGHVTTRRIFDGQTPRSAEPEFGKKLDSALRDMRDVFRHFRDRLRANPADDSARRNAERAQQQLQRLEEIQRQLQQQQQQQQPDQPQQSDQASQRRQGEQNQSEQQQQQSPRPQPQQEGQQRQQQQQQQQAEQGAGEQSEPPGEAQQQQAQSQAEQTPPAGSQEQRAASQLSDDEAERLLQRVRDRSRQRQQQRAAQQAREGGRVDKDW